MTFVRKVIKMGHLHYLALIFLLGEICFFVTGVDDFTVQFENQKTCFQENTNITFEIEYTGAGTPDSLQWKFNKMSVATDTLNIVTGICTAAVGADPAFPVTRMNYTCDNTNKKYTTTIKDFSEASDAGTWEVALSVSGVYTNFKNVTVEKCPATTVGKTGGLSTGAIVAIVIVVVVVIGVIIVLVILKSLGKLPCKCDKAGTSKNDVNTENPPDEKKKLGRPQPPPPFGPYSNHSQSPDKRGRANLENDDHPLVYINTPAHRADVLESIPDSAREDVKKKKKKRKKRVDTEDDQSD